MKEQMQTSHQLRNEVMKVKIDSPQAYAVYRNFYHGNIFHDFLKSNGSCLFHSSLLSDNTAKNIDPEVMYKNIKRIKPQDALNEYWAKHSKSYLDRLQTLSQQIPMNFIDTNTKLVISISVINEVDVDSAIEAVKQSFGEKFEDEVRVIIYHNFKSDPDEEVRTAIQEVKKRSNVAVVEERVAKNNNVSMAKKVATDIVQFITPQQMNIPILLMDADVQFVPDEMIQRGIQVLKKPFVLAVSPGLNYQSSIKDRFPILGLIQDLENAILDKELFDNFGNPYAIGQSTFISRSTLAAVGGIKPIKYSSNKLSVIPYEDMHLSEDLLASVAFEDQNPSKQKWPIHSLDIEGFSILTGADREISDLLSGQRSDARWNSPIHYTQLSGKRRIKWDNVSRDNSIAELGDFSLSNLLTAVNRYWVVKKAPIYETYHIQRQGSIWFLEALHKLGFDGKVIIQNYDDPTLPSEKLKGSDAILKLQNSDKTLGVVILSDIYKE